MRNFIGQTVRQMRRTILLLLLIAAPLLVATPAAAQTNGLILFYGALKVSQSQALKATGNYYEAIGMGARGQEMMRLAADFEKGTLGGADGVKTFTQVSEGVETNILELQALGAAPTAQQRALAAKARQQLGVARIAMVAAVASGVKVVLDSNGNALQKIVLGVVLASEAGKVLGALDRVTGAAAAYDNFELGVSNGFQVVSKEALPAFASL